MAYHLGEKSRLNYRQLADVQLPRAERTADKLYPVEITDETESEVKIHYKGYDSRHDEWRPREEIVALEAGADDEHELDALQLERYSPFDHHKELAYAIKAALCAKHRDPGVRIEVPFDILIFNGGLKCAGKFLRRFRGHDHYSIESSSDLVPLLGERWHIRGINKHKDFCAVKIDTVVFYLHKRASVMDYLNDSETDGGFVLIFKFVRLDCVHRQLDSYL